VSDDLFTSCFPSPAARARMVPVQPPLPSERTEFGSWQREGMVSSSQTTRSQPRKGVMRHRFRIQGFRKNSHCVGASVFCAGTGAARRITRVAEAPYSRPSTRAATTRGGVTLVVASVQTQRWSGTRRHGTRRASCS